MMGTNRWRQTDCYRASPLERGTAEPGGMYRKTDAESPIIFLNRTFEICAGSASVIHTPPLSWHPFQKGTLPRCRLYTHSSFLVRDRRAATARPLLERGTAEPGGMYLKIDVESPFII